MSINCQGYTITGENCKRKITGGCYCHQHANTNTYREKKPDECIICCESLVNQRYPLECGHWIHTACVINSAKAECPLCRQSIQLGKRDTARLEKVSKKRKIELIQTEQEDIRRELQNHMSEMVAPIIQENIQDIIIYMLENDTMDEDVLFEILHYIDE